MSGPRGIALAEILVALAIVGVLAAAALVVGERARRLSGLGESMANLRQLHTGHATFGNDRGDLVATFTWQPGPTPSQFPDLLNASDPFEAGAFQALDIMRRLTGSTIAQMPRIFNWAPHISYSHLVIAEHMGWPLPAPWLVSPEHGTLQEWRRTGQGPNPGDSTSYRWVYSSSYELPLAFQTNDAGRSGSPSVYTIVQSSTHNSFQLFPGGTNQSGVVGHRRYTEVRYPSQKAMMYETAARYTGPRVVWFGFAEARVPILFADGSVSVRRTGDANASFVPSAPTNAATTTVVYSPAPWEPPLPTGLSASVDGKYRWTRSGLRGRDFDGPSVPWAW